MFLEVDILSIVEQWSYEESCTSQWGDTANWWGQLLLRIIIKDVMMVAKSLSVYCLNTS